MKRTIQVLLLVLFAGSQLFAQKSLVKLTFTADLNSQHVDLDSIRIHNISQNCDTVLFWPDTTLSFVFSGVGFDEPIALPEEFTVKLLPTAGGEQDVRIGLNLPERGDVSFRLANLKGSLLGSFKEYHESGFHTFILRGGGERIVLLSVIWKGQVRTIKIANPAVQSGVVCQLHYVGSAALLEHSKFLALTSSFGFFPGDSLKITGYEGMLHTTIWGKPSVSTDYTIPFGMNFPCPGLPSFTYGGQVYNTVQIGNQCWMKENLNIGTMVASFYINNSSHSECTDNNIIEKYCYQNQQSNCALYGGLYDWNEMMQYVTIPGVQGICADGWHIPADAEWQILVDYLGGSTVAGGLLKETGFTTWFAPNTGATNESGFSALGAGHRFHYGHFGDINSYAEFWSSNEFSGWASSFRFLRNTNANMDPYDYFKTYGFSVRCVLND